MKASMWARHCGGWNRKFRRTDMAVILWMVDKEPRSAHIPRFWKPASCFFSFYHCTGILKDVPNSLISPSRICLFVLSSKTASSMKEANAAMSVSRV
jgi:hypothetical protein